MYMATKSGSMVAYKEELLLTKLHDSSITWSFDVA